MNVGDLKLERFAAQLAGEGVAIRWGPFASRIVSQLPELAAPLHLLYADFPLEPPASICDFSVCVRPRPLRLPWSQQRFELLLDHGPAFQPFPRKFALAALEWGLNLCVYGSAHRFLVVHAAVVERNGSALLLPGGPGAGKSTLCAALVTAGWRLLSDELALVDPQDGRVRALARPISLKNDAIGIIRGLAPETAFGPPAVDTRKGTVAHMKRRRRASAAQTKPLSRSGSSCRDSSRARSCDSTLFRNPAASGESPTIRSTTKYSARRGSRPWCGWIDRCPCYALTHSDLGDAVAALDDLSREPAASKERHASAV